MSTAESKPIGKRLAEKWLKLRMADHARLMADNEKVLQAERAQVERDRDYEQRVAESVASSRLGGGMGQSSQSGQSEAEEMKILIDSPTTTHIHEPEQPQPAQKKSSLWPLVLTAALAASGGGAAGLIPWALGAFSGDEPAASEYRDTTRRIEIEKYEPSTSEAE